MGAIVSESMGGFARIQQPWTGSPTTSKQSAPLHWRRWRGPISRKPKRPAPVAEVSALEAQLLASRLEAEKLRRDLYGQRSERTVRLLDQLELEFEEAEATASEDELAAELAAAKTTTVQAFTRARPRRFALPRASAARTRRRPGTDRLPVLRFGRSCASSAKRSPRRWRASAAMEGDPDGPGEIHLPGLPRRSASHRRRSTSSRAACSARVCWR